MLNILRYPSPVGMLNVIGDGISIVAIQSDGCRYPLSGAESAQHVPDDPVLKLAVRWLDRYFEVGNGLADGQAYSAPSPAELPLAPQGNAFRRTVWELLCKIPYGECITYGELARRYCNRTGRERMSAQAIGGAVGHNPVAIVIPCHRVIGTDGGLTGYAGGIEMKRELLRREGIEIKL